MASAENQKTEHNFANQDSEAKIKANTVKGGVLIASSQAIKLVVQTIATAILARILLPEDFGLVAMVLVISGFAMIIKDLGLSTATVQKMELTQSQVSCMFWMNVALGFLIAVFVSLLAPIMAMIYQEDSVMLATVAISSIFIIDSLGSQHFALLKRDMQFKKVVVIDFISVMVAIFVAVVLARYGAKYWALVAQVITQSACSTTQAWIVSKWRPNKPHWDPSVKQMLGFGTHLTLFNVADYAIRNVDNLLIGAYLGAVQLGFYSKAYNLLMLPIRQISNPIAAVALPALSKLQNDQERFSRLFISLCEISGVIAIPIVIYSFIDADILVLILLGEQWGSSTEAFRYLSFASLVGAVAFLPTVLCVSRGFPEIQLKWAVYTAPIIIAGFAFGLYWGINGVALSFSITYPIAFVIFIYMACKGSPVRPSHILKAFILPLISATVSGCALYIFKTSQFMDGVGLYLKPMIHFSLFLIMILVSLSTVASGRDLIYKLLNIKKTIAKS